MMRDIRPTPPQNLNPYARELLEAFAGHPEDDFPLPHSPAYHTFRTCYGWPEVSRGSHGLTPGWKISDLREEREDPCENMV
jgi:hypothetical protein